MLFPTEVEREPFLCDFECSDDLDYTTYTKRWSGRTRINNNNKILLITFWGFLCPQSAPSCFPFRYLNVLPQLRKRKWFGRKIIEAIQVRAMNDP